ncbi:nuclease-related domain-containing protein [Dietzia sp. B32]|uniref:nuclease-related domain-containing protein n=1 Tax=Dietzia sp. B32 TaxID=2915130 RepID=UPI0021ADC712|nr:nuclease-related domain-containing protein [Dietzia sp. B32]
MTETLPLLTLGLLAAIVLGVLWHASAQKRWQAQLTAISTELSQAEQRHSATLSEARAAHSRAIANEHDFYRQIRSRLQLSAGERTSRAHILSACREARIDAVVMSNVLFRPPEAADGKVFHAQVDHLVVTERGLLIVESKYWKYAVFDGVDFRAQSDALHILFGDLVGDLTRQQAVHLYREDDHVRLRTSSPAGQARLQAQRLSAFLTTRGITPPWVNTCVYYCHPDSKVHHADFNNQTAIVSTYPALGRTIMSTQTAGNARVNVDSIVSVLAPLSTDTTGTGIHRHKWTSILDACSEDASGGTSFQSSNVGRHARAPMSAIASSRSESPTST